MKPLYQTKNWPPRKKLQRRPQRTWLIHTVPDGDGILHWLIVTRSLEEAWIQAQELPRKRGTAPRLGGVIEAPGWPAFMREKLCCYCNECNPKGQLMISHEEQMWAAWVAKHEGRMWEVVQ